MANQIELKIGTNTKRTTKIVEDSISPKKAFEKEGIDFSRATVTLDGAPLGTKEMNQSFAELGIKENAYLVAVIKTDNAA